MNFNKKSSHDKLLDKCRPHNGSSIKEVYMAAKKFNDHNYLTIVYQ